MRIPPGSLRDFLGAIKFPVNILLKDSDTIALPSADRDLVESLIDEEALYGIGTRTRIKLLKLTKSMSEIRYSIKKKTLPVAEDCRTTFREDLGNGRFVFTHHMERCAAYG